MHILPHSFNRYQLTEGEQVAGATLTSANLAVIQNLIADTSEEKIALVCDPKEFNSYIQQEAYLAGQLKILRYLVDLHENVTTIPQHHLGE